MQLLLIMEKLFAIVRNNSIIFFVGSLLFLLNGCSGLRNMNTLEDSNKKLAAEKIAESLKSNETPKYFLIDDCNVKISGKNSFNARLRFYNEENNYIFISGRYLGFEIFRAKLTNDSIFYINRIEKVYMFETLEAFYDGLFSSFKLADLQKFLFSGWYMNNYRYNEKRIFDELFLRDNFLSRKILLEKGMSLEFDYLFTGKLQGIRFMDHVRSLYLDVEIQRKGKNIDFVKSDLFSKDDKKSILIKFSDIRYQKYTKTDFNLGNNYKAINIVR